MFQLHVTPHIQFAPHPIMQLEGMQHSDPCLMAKCAPPAPALQTDYIPMARMQDPANQKSLRMATQRVRISTMRKKPHQEFGIYIYTFLLKTVTHLPDIILTGRQVLQKIAV